MGTQAFASRASECAGFACRDITMTQLGDPKGNVAEERKGGDRGEKRGRTEKRKDRVARGQGFSNNVRINEDPS